MLITMFRSKYILFGLVAAIYISFCAANSDVRCAEADRQALLKLKAGFVDETNKLSTWKDDVDCCQWKGILCNNVTGHVIKMDLQTSLSGKIDSSLCELQHLTFIDLSFNAFREQKIPSCIGSSLGQLRFLRLAYSALVGTIPRELGNLSNLHTLDLAYNDHLSPSNLEWLSHLSNLEYLDLTYVNLSLFDDWPSTIGKIPSLSVLILAHCELPHVNPIYFSSTNTSTSLKFLNLTANNLNSSIVPWVLTVSKVMTHLQLSFNSFRGPIPHDFGIMTSLESLDFTSNELEGGIPKSFGNLCNLKELRLSSNNLSGQASDSIHQLCSNQSRMEILELIDNPFSCGPFPDLTRFPSLNRLILGNTSLCGVLPHSLEHLPHLSELSLNDNNLTGPLPEFKGLSSLETLDLSNNHLNGTLPQSMGQLSSLIRLHLFSNNLKGVITQKHLSGLSKLRSLALSGNHLSFNVSPDWVPPFQLQELYISSCSLNFDFPAWLKNQSLLESLDISDGGISGSLSSFCATPKSTLYYLDLSNNSLSGTLPDCLGQIQNLRVLNLARNNFYGEIPKSLGTLPQIEIIHLNNNNLSGGIPPLMDSLSLKSIDFGNNNLEGELPTWIGNNFIYLIVLRLKANRFRGSIPSSLCNLLYLQILDLSRNDITGLIPQCLNKINAMSDIKFLRASPSYEAYGLINLKFNDKASLVWKGAEMEYEKNLGLMTTIDLSCNHLIGEIPNTITDLVALASLNLSRNNLTGFIPSSVGQMRMLESFDLSKNRLSGIIPASMSNLSFLSYLNLSFNDLSGSIPQTTQLLTFDASTYFGNQKLCGQPLEKCSDDENFQSSPSGAKREQDEFLTLGFYVSAGLGFISAFWAVCGSLIFVSSWRKAYFQFFSNLSDWIYVRVVVCKARMKKKFQN